MDTVTSFRAQTFLMLLVFYIKHQLLLLLLLLLLFTNVCDLPTVLALNQTS
jgi:hypothetical protein